MASKKTVNYEVRWHIKFQFEELAKDIEKQAEEHPEGSPVGDAMLEIATVVQNRADDIQGVDPT